MGRPNQNDIHQIMKTIKVSLADTGTVVTAVTGKKIVVTSIVLVCAAAVSVNWEDDTTDISGVMSFPALGGYAMSGDRLLETTAGNALKLTLSDTIQVSGHISYYEE